LKRTHRLAVRRAGPIGLFALALLWALAASGQSPEASPALVSPAEAGPAESVADPAAVAPPPAPTDPAEQASLIEQAWLAPAADFDARVTRVQRTALELGAWSLDAAARSLAVPDTSASAIDRANAAALLAPDLPAAHMRLAQELWLERGETFAAMRAVRNALSAIGRHLEASLWFAGSGLFVLAVALVAAGLLAAALAGSAALAHAAHDLGHVLPGAVPGFACWAALAAVLALPLALGEGGLGLALALLGVAAIYGGPAQRRAMLIAAAGIALGAYPVIRYAGVAFAALPADPVAQAAFAVAQGIPTPVEVARLTNLADRDPLAARGLAIHARRLGDLARADALYDELLAAGADDVSVQNNAADVQLALGNTDRAIELYAFAARTESPIVLFNLAQAYGRAFRVEELNQTIARAQRAGGDLVARLTALQGGSEVGFVADLPPGPGLFWSRAVDSRAGADLAQEFRGHFAPGRLGRDARVFGAVAAALVLIGGMFGARIQPSHACQRCRERICRRCSPYGTDGDVCDGCYTLFFAPEKTDRALRNARVTELREREQRIARVHTALSLLVPGAAGQLAARPLVGWLGAFCFALAGAAFFWRAGVVPDPGVAGAAAPAVFVGAAALAAILYAAAVATSLAARREE
jgi:tetratricopeptide (TPR) repeat protein